jgi:2-dehydropantoate 2-reductase
MTFKRILILGAGAIGSVLGAFLSKCKPVTLIGNKEHVGAVNSKGLTILGREKETFHPEAKTSVCKIPPDTLVILSAKAYDTVSAVQGIERLLMEDTVILVLQNGIGNEDVVKRIVKAKSHVLRGITNIAAEFLKPGQVRYWHGTTTIEHNRAAEQIAETMNSCGIKTSLSNHINDDVWIKSAVNCVVNPLTAIFGVRNCDIVTNSLDTVRHGVVEECVKVGEAEGITFPQDFTRHVDTEIMHYSNYSSMYQDIKKKRKTEIDFLNGKIVELGERHLIPTPFNYTLLHLVKYLEEKNEFPRDH